MERFFRVLSADVLAKAVLGFVSLVLIRYLPAETFAAYTFVVAIATAVAQTLAAGFNRIYIVGRERFALQGKSAPYLGLQLMLVVLMATAAGPWMPVARRVYLACVALSVGFVASEFAKTRFQRRQRFNSYSLTELARTLLQAAAIVSLLLLWGDSIRVEWVLLVQALALLIAGAIALGVDFKWRSLFDLRTSFTIAYAILRGRYVLLLWYFGLVAMLSQLDVFMLKWLASQQVLAAYGAAARYYALISLALGAVHAVMLPAIVEIRSRAQLGTLIDRHRRLLLLFAPVVLGLIGFAPWLLPVIDRGRYPESIAAFQVLAVSSIISFAFSPQVNLLMRQEDFRLLALVVAVALVCAFLLHAALIPRYGAVGAAVATLASAALANGCFYLRARRLAAQLTD